MGQKAFFNIQNQTSTQGWFRESGKKYLTPIYNKLFVENHKNTDKQLGPLFYHFKQKENVEIYFSFLNKTDSDL